MFICPGLVLSCRRLAPLFSCLFLLFLSIIDITILYSLIYYMSTHKHSIPFSSSTNIMLFFLIILISNYIVFCLFVCLFYYCICYFSILTRYVIAIIIIIIIIVL